MRVGITLRVGARYRVAYRPVGIERGVVVTTLIYVGPARRHRGTRWVPIDREGEYLLGRSFELEPGRLVRAVSAVSG